MKIQKEIELDFVFVNKPLTQKEEKEFSYFLKKRKLKLNTKKVLRTGSHTRSEFV